MPSALIAEDEPLLRAQLRDALASVWPELHIIAETDDGLAAARALAQARPDVLFLDIRMPGMSGLDLARQCSQRAHVVFVTAYDDYAIEAFEQGAVDYVLKPLQPARLLVTVERLKERLASPPRDLSGLIASLAQRKDGGHLRWIQASAGNQLRFITVDEVICFQADSKYTRVATAQLEAYIRKPIRELALALDPTQFWQVHRSSIINIAHIDRVLRGRNGAVEVRMRGRGDALPVSQPYQHLFRQM